MDLLLNIAWWAPAILWALLYVSDFSLTMLGRRLYLRLDGRFVQFEGYELTPMFREDVERGRWLSPISLFMLALTTVFVAFLGWLGQGEGLVQAPALFMLGLMFLTEGAVHVRHVRNIGLFRSLLHSEDVEGLLRYRRRFSYGMSAIECAAFAGLFLLVAAADRSWFCVGGAVGMAGFYVQHRRRTAAQEG